jgi:hypothetical protein
MVESTAFPVAFYIALGLLALAGAFAWNSRVLGVGFPLGAVLGTVGLWYFGDAIYNDYQIYALQIGPQYLEEAWWQVALFLFFFLILTPTIHRIVNRKVLADRSEFWELMKRGGIDNSEFQRRLDIATRLITGVWFVLMAIALLRTNFDFLGLFAPYISGKANPWGRGRVVGGRVAGIVGLGFCEIEEWNVYQNRHPRRRVFSDGRLDEVCYSNPKRR